MSENGLLHQLARDVRAAAAVSAERGGWQREWAELVVVADGLFDREVLEGFQACWAPARREEPSELVRVHLNLADGDPRIERFSDLLAMEIEPFIIGAGQVRVKKTPEGIVVLRGEQ